MRVPKSNHENFEKKLKDLEKVHQKNSLPQEISFRRMALSASCDMIAAIAVGFGLGLALEHFISLSPWGMIIGFLLGSIAGLLNVHKGLKRAGYGFQWKESLEAMAKAKKKD